MARLCGRHPASRDDLVNRREPALLKARAFSRRKSEGVFTCRKRVEQVRPPWAIGIFAHQAAQGLAIAALRHRKQGAQDSLQRRGLKNDRQIGPGRLPERKQHLETRLAKMRQQRANAARRERQRQETALTAPIRAFREKEPCAAERAREARDDGRAAIVRGIGRQHMTHAFGIVDEERLQSHHSVWNSERIENEVRKDRQAGPRPFPEETPDRQDF